jgi:hypothetical protein
MAVYIATYLAGIIYNLNFKTLIVNTGEHKVNTEAGRLKK